jgi:hypothetical protein
MKLRHRVEATVITFGAAGGFLIWMLGWLD